MKHWVIWHWVLCHIGYYGIGYYGIGYYGIGYYGIGYYDFEYYVLTPQIKAYWVIKSKNLDFWFCTSKLALHHEGFCKKSKFYYDSLIKTTKLNEKFSRCEGAGEGGSTKAKIRLSERELRCRPNKIFDFLGENRTGFFIFKFLQLQQMFREWNFRSKLFLT